MLVGASPAIVRTVIIGSLALVAEQIGRRSTSLNSLGFSTALMCLANLLILPVQPLLMIFSGAAVLAGLALSAYTIRVVEALADLPGGVWSPGQPYFWRRGRSPTQAKNIWDPKPQEI